MKSLLLASLLSAAPPAGPHPFTAEDMVRLRRVSSPAVSPDGKSVAYVLRTTDMDANRGRTDLWLVGVDGSGQRQLTRTPDGESQPVWAPDGKSLYYLATTGGSSQVWRLTPGGGRAQQVTKLPLDVGAFALSPDGKQLAVALEVFPDCDSVACTTKRLEEKKAQKSTGQLYDKLMVRHWDTWKDGRRSHLFVLPASGQGTPRDLMQGMDADSPSKPFGDASEFTFTPDSQGLVFTARDAGREEAWSTNLDVWHVPLSGQQKPRRLSKSGGTDTGPVFSPDGKWLAYRSMERAGFEADKLRIVLQAWPGGEERFVAADWDRSAGSLSFSPDGRTLYTTADDIGQHALFAVDVESGKVRYVVPKGFVGEAAVATGDQLVYTHDHLTAPADLWAVKADGTSPRQLTRVNEKELANIRFGEREQFSFAGWNGEKVHGWVVKPVGFDPTKKYPLAFLIHGGPQGSFGNHFHYRWNPQTYAGRGYVAVMVDFHGSTGYGQAFTDSIRGDWGGKPLEDLQKGLEYVLKRYDFVDEGRMCALGASYGGYMINWIAGNWSDRFRCLVNHDGNLDERMAYYDTEELWFPEWEHGGTPWENPEGYNKHNPIEHVSKWKTPMFVIHGGKDYRVVDTQGISTFTALQRKGIPSKFLYFADENHWVLKPANSVHWHDEVLDWLDQWTGNKPQASTPR